MPTNDDDLTQLLTNVAALIRGITASPPAEWQRRANDLADALEALATTDPRHPR
jgi:hypothetical protein